MLKLTVVCLLLIRIFISLANSAPVATSDCQAKRKLFLETGVPQNEYLPICNSDGSYRNVQKRGEEYFCVDKNGAEILGTSRPQTPDCSRISKCQMNRGQKPFAPKCNPDGTFQALQCEPKSGKCFCVTPHEGRVREGTSVYYEPETKLFRCKATDR